MSEAKTMRAVMKIYFTSIFIFINNNNNMVKLLVVWSSLSRFRHSTHGHGRPQMKLNRKKKLFMIIHIKNYDSVNQNVQVERPITLHDWRLCACTLHNAASHFNHSDVYFRLNHSTNKR